MEWAGVRVLHRMMGEGTVIRLEDNYLYVAFDGLGQEKMFVYPACFAAFLATEDERACAEIDKAQAERTEKENMEKLKRLAKISELRKEAQQAKSTARASAGKVVKAKKAKEK